MQRVAITIIALVSVSLRPAYPNPVNITNSVFSEQAPSWSPDGSRLAISSDEDGARQIYLLDVFDASTTRLTFEPAVCEYPTWSPDGSRIAFRAGP